MCQVVVTMETNEANQTQTLILMKWSLLSILHPTKLTPATASMSKTVSNSTGHCLIKWLIEED